MGAMLRVVFCLSLCSTIVLANIKTPVKPVTPVKVVADQRDHKVPEKTAVQEVISSDEIDEKKKKTRQMVDAPPADDDSSLPKLPNAEPDFDEATSEHRRRRRETCGAKNPISKREKKDALNAHNMYRSKEKGANIVEMKWNKRLAERAQQWANECKWRHGMASDCHKSTALGQNLYIASKGRSGGAYPDVNYTRIISMWADEKVDYNYVTRGCKSGKMCGHYTQVVWWSSNSVGCAVARCPIVSEGITGKPWKNAVIVACDYYLPGNVRGNSIYSKGAPCSKCADVVKVGYKCKRNLCKSCNPVKDAKCKCVKRSCENGGKWRQKRCKCACPKAFYGRLCENPCVCADHAMYNCASLKSRCTVATSRAIMQKICPKTCSFCPRAPAKCRK